MDPGVTQLRSNRTSQHNSTIPSCDTTRHDTTRHDTTRHDTVRHGTTRSGTTQQHETTQRDATQYNPTTATGSTTNNENDGIKEGSNEHSKYEGSNEAKAAMKRRQQ